MYLKGVCILCSTPIHLRHPGQRGIQWDAYNMHVGNQASMSSHIVTTWSAIHRVLFPTNHDVLKWRSCGREITHSRGLKWNCMFFMLSKVIYYWYFNSLQNHTVCLHLVPINHENWYHSTVAQEVGRHWPPTQWEHQQKQMNKRAVDHGCLVTQLRITLQYLHKCGFLWR
jgi:hypothetical protein